jgi:ribosomal protein S27E
MHVIRCAECGKTIARGWAPEVVRAQPSLAIFCDPCAIAIDAADAAATGRRPEEVNP